MRQQSSKVSTDARLDQLPLALALASTAASSPDTHRRNGARQACLTVGAMTWLSSLAVHFPQSLLAAFAVAATVSVLAPFSVDRRVALLTALAMLSTLTMTSPFAMLATFTMLALAMLAAGADVSRYPRRSAAPALSFLSAAATTAATCLTDAARQAAASANDDDVVVVGASRGRQNGPQRRPHQRGQLHVQRFHPRSPSR
jgi:hypothetical protein